MREIILLRHAHADPAAPGEDDAARNLSARGGAEADAASAWLREHGVRADRILVSPSARTRQTCDRVVGALQTADVRVDPLIYEATPAALLRVLDEHVDAGTLVVVGHNPGLETLVALLTEGASDSGRGMPPGGIAWLALPAGPIEPGEAQVRHFWWP